MALTEASKRSHTHLDNGNAFVLPTSTKGGALRDLDKASRSMAEPACHRSCDSLRFPHTFKTVEVFAEVQLEIAFHQQYSEHENAKQVLNIVRTHGTIHAIQDFN